MSEMLKSSGAMSVATFLSRLLGMVREIIYARFMGDGPVASAFKLAFMIPNLFRRLLGEGALTAAFIPIFKEKEKRAGEREMWEAANAVISGLVVSASAVVAVVCLGISLVLAIAGKHMDAETHLMLSLLRVIFPYMLLVCLAAVFMGMLNARGHFFIPAMGATMLNVVMICSVLFLAPHFGKRLPTQVFALAVGALVAGVAQSGFQLPLLFREGFRWRWVRPWPNETVREVIRKMVPGTIGVAAFQINILVTQSVAFAVGAHIVASFDYAVRLMEFPQGMFGIALATYLLPTLAGLAAEGKYSDFRATLRQGLGYLIFVNLIASVLLLVLAKPIVRLLFQHGHFGEMATSHASLALSCLAPGLVAFSSVNILARAFYALGDTETPMKVSILCLGLNLVFALWLIGPLRQGGLGLANSMTSYFNVGLLLYALRRKLGRLDMAGMPGQLLSLLGAGVVAGLLAWGLSHYWEGHLGARTLLLKVGAVFVPLIAAGTAYWLLALWLRVEEARDFVKLFLRRRDG